ncbi:uncharacterized protein LOC118186866 [Stegodyphus dumicola]|uniref:uncharacterized protein LOC118186866 n=1 Tax=Stegodyphus dumicola TaxID=202533 RepID=UPI0015AC1FFC|nr:uncharacterized protein LOC118186866 [Stegodyphus dumicola]
MINDERYNGHELVTVSVLLPHYGNVYFNSMYNSPKNILDINYLAKILDTNKQVILAGDLNARSQEWNCRKTNKNGIKLSEFIKNYPVYFHVPSEYTNVPQNTNTGDILDIFLSTISFSFDLEVLQELDSNHCPVIATLGTTKDVMDEHINTTNWKVFNEILSECHTNNFKLRTPDDIELAAKQLTMDIKSAYHSASRKIPRRQITNKLPNRIKNLIRDRNKLRKRFHLTCDPNTKKEMNRLSREIKKQIITHRKDLWDEKIESFNEPSSSFWSFVRRLKNKPTVNRPIYHEQGIALTNIEKCNTLAEHFEKQFTTNTSPCNQEFSTFVNFTVTEWIHKNNMQKSFRTSLRSQEILNIIKKLRNRKAPGQDNVNNVALKWLPINMVNRLTGYL